MRHLGGSRCGNADVCQCGGSNQNSVQCSGLPEPASRLPRAQMWLVILVGVAGFEPATPASRTQCSTGLSHTPTRNAAYSLGFRAPQGADLRKLITVNIRLKTQILPAGAAAVAA